MISPDRDLDRLSFLWMLCSDLQEGPRVLRWQSELYKNWASTTDLSQSNASSEVDREWASRTHNRPPYRSEAPQERPEDPSRRTPGRPRPSPATSRGFDVVGWGPCVGRAPLEAASGFGDDLSEQPIRIFFVDLVDQPLGC